MVFGTVGRITFQKNPQLFNQIAQHFQGDDRVKFLWIGDGELRHEIQENDQVQVTGWVTPDEVQNYLKQVDVYISTSLWEGLPLSVLEAMALGKPLLLSDCVGNVDTVEQGVNGFLYHDSQQAIEKIKHFLTLSKKSMLLLERASYELAKTNFSLVSLRNSYKDIYIF